MLGEDGLGPENPNEEEEQNVTEQSSGIVQFRMQPRGNNGLHEADREEEERQQLRLSRRRQDGEQRQSTPHLQGQSGEASFHAQGDVEYGGQIWEQEGLGRASQGPADDYHGDVRPRVHHRMQGGGDLPGQPGFGRNWPRAVGYPPDFHRGMPQGERTGRPLVKPERYDGGEDWITYLHHFEWCAELNGWSESEKARFLTVSVTGTARQVLAGVERDRLRDYGTVVQILRSRFDPIGRMELHRIQLKNRV